MAVTLNASISWTTAAGDDAAMLDHLQPNILKPHTREFLSILFLKFSNGPGGRAFLRDIATLMKSAKAHLQETKAFKASGTPGSAYVGVGLTAAGYAALGIAPVPADTAFKGSMQSTAALNDPAVATWDAHFRKKADLHAIVLIGDMSMEGKSNMHDKIAVKINAATGVSVLGTQDGMGQHNANAQGIEHFGYVDGRSQPLFFEEDILGEEDGTDGIANWSPRFPLGQAIVADTAAPNPALHFGSYLVFRKLEQNVRRFKDMEEKFASRLKIEDDERAGGMLVGRFEDGTAVTLQSSEGMHSPVPNNFNYDSDTRGGKCPFLGHIRKTNPRGSGGFNQTAAQERAHLMPRRGQTYGVRTDNPNDGLLDNKPTGNVGLLFMAFNADIRNQFEFTQIQWANNPAFPQVKAGVPQPGVDPVIGQTPGDAARPSMTAAKEWGDPGSLKTVSPVPRTVTMKGGEYFFMPSLAMLRAL